MKITINNIPQFPATSANAIQVETDELGAVLFSSDHPPENKEAYAANIAQHLLSLVYTLERAGNPKFRGVVIKFIADISLKDD